jgi:type I restriction enzyme, S subunit
LEIPDNWEVKPMKRVSRLKNGAILTGPFGSMLHSSDYVENGIPFVLGKNIKNGEISDIDIPRISKKDAERLSRYSLKEGDLVFSRVGTVGSATLVKSENEGWIISGLVLRIRFENPDLNPYFLNYFIQSDIFSRILEPELLNASRDFINTTILESIHVLIPPKPEQDKIVSILSLVDSKIRFQQTHKRYLEYLKKGLMQKLLTGKIRVKV